MTRVREENWTIASRVLICILFLVVGVLIVREVLDFISGSPSLLERIPFLLFWIGVSAFYLVIEPRRRNAGPSSECRRCGDCSTNLPPNAPCPECGMMPDTAVRPASPPVQKEPEGQAAARLRAFLRGRDVPCLECGYNLRDLADARCPECGVQLTLNELEFQDRTYSARRQLLAVACIASLISLPIGIYLPAVGVLMFLCAVAAAGAREADRQIYLDRRSSMRARSVPSFGRMAIPLGWGVLVIVVGVWGLVAVKTLL